MRRDVRTRLCSRFVRRKYIIAVAITTSIPAPRASRAVTHECICTANSAYEDAVKPTTPAYMTSTQRAPEKSAVKGPTSRSGEGRTVYRR